MYNKELRKAKRENFRSFCTNINNTPAAARLHKILSKDRSGTVGSLLKADGSFTENEEQRAHLLLETHFPGSKLLDVSCIEETVEQYHPRASDWRTAGEICTQYRIEWAIDTFQPYKTPGVDGIFPALLQRGKKEIMPFLIRIFRASLALRYIPKAWRMARVVFIPKVGKKDTTLPKSFRPISLTSFVVKTMEKIIDNYIRSTALVERPLHQSQHAYRAGRSTETALYQLTNNIRKAIDCGETAICAFLDIEGAFDNTSHDVVRRALESRCVGDALVGWTSELLRTRSAETQMGQNSYRIRTTRGCPQGGVLSPLLWSLVADDLLCALSTQGITSQGYADDIIIITRGKFEETLFDLVERGLRITWDWCAAVGLRVNPSKTTVVPFTRKRKLPRLRRLNIGGTVLEHEREVKYLGVILDSKLLWNAHEKQVTVKAKRALFATRALAGRTWGCNPSVMQWLYTMVVRPMITYGAVAWASRTELKTTKKTLGTVQRLACISITGSMRTCPTAAMEVILGLTPLHLVIQRAARETVLRISSQDAGPGNLVASLDRECLVKSNPLIDLPKDSMVKRFCFERNFTSITNTKQEWLDRTNTPQWKSNAITWYTDGSKTEKGVGLGVSGPRVRYSEPMGTYPSVFQAEVCAIERCAQFNLMRGYQKQNIWILSDSQAGIRALSATEISSKLIWECRAKLNWLGKNNTVTLCWVPGHSGIEGNEEADRLARRGSSLPFTGPQPYCGIAPSYIKEKLRKQELSERAQTWENLPGHRQAKLLLGNYNTGRCQAVIGLTRNRLRNLTAFLTGHCRLNQHLKKIGIEENDSCRFCGEAGESPLHLLTDCDALSWKRGECFGTYRPSAKDLASLNPLHILDFIKNTGLDEVL